MRETLDEAKGRPVPLCRHGGGEPRRHHRGLGGDVSAGFSRNRLHEIHRLEASLTERFAVFETMLRSQHERITAHMDKVLPEIVTEIESLGTKDRGLSVTELNPLTKKYDIQHIYFIDRAHKVFQTNLAGDMNLAFPESPFTRFLDSSTATAR